MRWNRACIWLEWEKKTQKYRNIVVVTCILHSSASYTVMYYCILHYRYYIRATMLPFFVTILHFLYILSGCFWRRKEIRWSCIRLCRSRRVSMTSKRDVILNALWTKFMSMCNFLGNVYSSKLLGLAKTVSFYVKWIFLSIKYFGRSRGNIVLNRTENFYSFIF